MKNGFSSLAVLASLLIFGCTGGDGISVDPDATPTPTPTPTATPVPPGGGGTVVIGETPGLCSAGDVARVDLLADGTARFPLVLDDDPCTPAKDNRNEEYTLIMYNTTSSARSFRIDAPLNSSPPASITALTALDEEDFEIQSPSYQPSYSTGPMESSMAAYNLQRSYPELKYEMFGQNQGGATMALEVVEGMEVPFIVRNSPSDDESFETTSAILATQGTHINVYVDRDIWPEGGDCTNSNLPEDCLDETDTDKIAAVFDYNIWPLETEILGSESDVDGDTRVDLLITPILNTYLDTHSYTDPRNLLPFSAVSNPGSNEREVIFAFAPDSLAHHEILGNGIDAASYMNKTLLGWLAFQFSKIISYNQHVFVAGGSPEVDWIEDGIGTVMADLAGFNIWRGGAYLTLAAPHLDDIRQAEDLDLADREGAEYLFMLYLLQSQMDDTYSSSDSDGFDDDLDILGTLVQSELNGVENLEAALDVDFDEETETEFASLFKDWAIAMATSGSGRTDLQQSGQDEVKYYYNLNPEIYGTSISNANGSRRVGADGDLAVVAAAGDLDADSAQNYVGMDLNAYNDEDELMFENGDEHVWAPGNPFYGYVDPYSSMYVRLAGLFLPQQTVAIRADNGVLQGFIVRRSDITYPHVYSESTFGTINQFPEDLDAPGNHNFFGVDKKIDYESLVSSATNDTDLAQDFLSIVGRIDMPEGVYICPEDRTDCRTGPVRDTDKYTFTIPDLGRTDEGDLALVVRRQHDNGSDTSALKPMLAIVSSKDVPYPYADHPARNDSPASGTAATRPQYRWLTTYLPCGDDDAGAYSNSLNDTNTNTKACSATPAVPPDGGNVVSSRITFSGAMENTGTWYTGIGGGIGDITDPADWGTWDGDITGAECDYASSVDNVYGGSVHAVTDEETSPSSLGQYAWVLGKGATFMDYSYGFTSNDFPVALFSREFLIPVSGYPSLDPEAMYDPRSNNTLSLNCQTVTDDEPDLTNDAPDDVLVPDELRTGQSLVEQVLMEMSRGRSSLWDSGGSTSVDEMTGLNEKYRDFDVLGLDGDSWDFDTKCSLSDVGNNVHGFTVRGGEHSMVIGLTGGITSSGTYSDIGLSGSYWATELEPHIAFDYEASGDLPPDVPSSDNQKIYRRNTSNENASAETVIRLRQGRSYTIIVGGMDQTVGNYELRLRKINRENTNPVNMVTLDEGSVDCEFAGLTKGP